MAESKSVLVLLGSPRKKGNSAALARQIKKGAEEAGAEVEVISLNSLSIRPCQGCYHCQKPDGPGCAVDDDMQALYPKLLAADAWVIASPVYWFTMSAQTKLFMDRCFALYAEGTKKRFAEKRIAVAMSYEDADPFKSGCVNALRTFQDAYNYVGAEIVGMVYGRANKPGEIEKNAALLSEAETLGRILVSG
jgi:multimeric flavodoxin WrbA